MELDLQRRIQLCNIIHNKVLKYEYNSYWWYGRKCSNTNNFFSMHYLLFYMFTNTFLKTVQGHSMSWYTTGCNSVLTKLRSYGARFLKSTWMLVSSWQQMSQQRYSMVCSGPRDKSRATFVVMWSITDSDMWTGSQYAGLLQHSAG